MVIFVSTAQANTDYFSFVLQGAFWSMMAGFGVGMIRMGLEFGYKVPPCGSGRIVIQS